MKAISVTEPGGPGVLRLLEKKDPVPAAGEVRVAVHYAGVNRADLLQRRGLYPAPPDAPADIPGLEFAGAIDQVGPGVRDWSEGDRVMGLLGGGGYAEKVVVPSGQLLPIPDWMTWREAGAVPEVFLTASDALFGRGALGKGEAVLVHTAGGGVGTAALQLSRAAGANTIIGTASQPKLDLIEQMGLPIDLAIPREEGSFHEKVLEYTDGQGVDVIMDTVGAAYWDSNIRSLATKGRLVIVGVLGGAKVQADLRALMTRRATVVGTVLRSRPKAEKAEVTREFADRWLPLFGKGLRHVIDRSFPLGEAGAAHAYMETNASFGKVLLDVAG